MRTLYDTWCAPDGTCLGVGSTLETRAAVVVLRANGHLGPLRQVFCTGAALNSITCPPGGGCIAVGGGGNVAAVVEVGRDGTPDVGRAVEGMTEHANSEWFYSLSCIAPATCGVVGNMSGQAVFAWHGPVPG